VRHWWDITISATRPIIKLIHVTVDLFFHDDGTGGSLPGGWEVKIVVFLASRVALYIRKQVL